MGRKKQQIPQIDLNVSQLPEVSKTAKNYLTYQGNVKIQLVRGNKVYKEINQHNEGTPELFRFLANTLAGNNSSSNAPKYVHTFYNQNLYDENGNINSNMQGNDIYGNTVNCKPSCVLNIPYSSVEVRYDAILNSGIGGYSTEFSFMIPYSQISGNTNILAIYNTTSFGNNIVPLAYLKLEKNKMLELGTSNTSNIIIKWVMTIGN